MSTPITHEEQRLHVAEATTQPVEVTFEFFPPKTEAMQKKLWASVEKLSPLGPDFVSVTYGAGGTTRERTHETVRRIVNETSLPVAAHLTCVAAAKAARILDNQNSPHLCRAL